MTIGPFSLMTKLLADPITPLYLGGTGVRGEDNPEVQMVEVTLEMAVQVVLRSITAQIAAGAKAVFVAEPAANKAYISPNQIAAGSDIFERFVMNPNRRIKALLDRYNVDLIFHCCGELIDSMVQHFASLDPAILSLGSSRKLWEDSALVSKRTVLYGNLPTKRFYSDDAITIDQVCQQARELIDQMCQVNHPFILGSECDVLSVPGCEKTIRAKVDAMMTCDCAACL
jgi:uroporphyrinogen-III decarboxylase